MKPFKSAPAKSALAGIALATVMMAAGVSHAASFVVDAKANSSSGGVAKATITLTSGETFHVSVPTSDLWSAGGLPRWSDANGLTANFYATGTDESGQSAGTLIGQSFGIHSQNGLDAPFGALVGEIGGVYKLLGTSFNGPAWNSGTLNLYYWDSNNGDNSQFITASVAVPEASTWAMMLIGFLGLGALMRSNRRKAAAIAA